MTITVTAHPDASPPSCSVVLSLPAGSVTSEVTLYRNDANGRALTRTQPVAGFDSRTVTDYECPWDQNVTYDWDATYIDPALFVTVFNSTWAALTGWSQLSGSWNVSGGKARVGSIGVANLRRSTTVARYRVTIDSLTAADGESAAVYFYKTAGAAGTPTFYIQNSGGVLGYGGFTAPGKTITTIDPSQPITVDMLESSVLITGTGGTYTAAGSLTMGTIILSAVTLAANSVQYGAVKVQSYPAPSHVAEQSSPVTLEPDDAWLVHPADPETLSLRLSPRDVTAPRLMDIGPIVNRTNTTVHRVLASATPIPTTTGDRSADETSMSVLTFTADQAAALDDLLTADVPLYIQIPEWWGADFPGGFYQVGDTDLARWVNGTEPGRTIHIPLTRVTTPVVATSAGSWTYAALALEFVSYASVTGAFATYADLATNTRI